jgi:hypothetical protein
MRILFWRAVVPALALVLGGMRPLSAQAMVHASTFVPVASPTGIGVRNLSFGNITPTPGVTQTVTVPAAVAPQSGTRQSGQFNISVAGAAGVAFQLTLPAVLTSTIGGLTLPVSFNGNQFGAHCVVQGAGACTLTAFNPATAGTLRICRLQLFNTCLGFLVWPNNTQIRVFLGGSLAVPPATAAATYTGVVTLTITQVY